MSALPEQLKGKPFILVARLSPKSGKEDRVLELLLPIVRSANSSNEPDCHTYRLSRSVDGSQIVVYEEYANEQALKTHGSTPEYQALVKAKDSEDLLNSMEVSFMEEFKPQDSRL